MNDLTRIASLGVLAIDGPDAATFLQGQATCDTRALSASRGALGALCNLQGRMIVSFYVLPGEGGLQLVMPADRVDAVLSHLKKYAVFSKVSLRAANELAVVNAPGNDGEAFTVTRDGALVRMALAGARGIGIAPPAQAMAGDTDVAWRAAAIAAGELIVGTATADRFLPQALNYDVIDGVSFRKGCYTGQEVVARMHFKGRMKERLYAFTADATDAPAANSAIVDAEGKPVGEVVDAVVDGGRCLVGAVVRHEAVASGTLHVATPAGPRLSTLPLPYPVPA